MSNWRASVHHNYRVFILDNEGHIINRAHLSSQNDEAAKERARHFASSGLAVELWDGPRRIATAIESRTMRPIACSRSRRIATVDVVHDLAAAETVWRSLESPNHSATPYQRFDFLAAWQRQVGERAGLSPFLVIASDDDGRPLVLLPLVLRTVLGIRCACFMGGSHSTLNMGLWERDFAAAATEHDLYSLIAMLAARDEADALVLRSQPTYWFELQNPLKLLPHEPSTCPCPVRTIEPRATPVSLISEALRRRLQRKERKLQRLAGYRYHIASDDADITRLLDWFFQVKAQRMAQRKQPFVFAEPGVQEFIRAACITRLADGGRAIEIHALECDEEVIAVFAGVSDGHRFSMMFNTYTVSQNARFSPGLILMREVIDHFAGQNYRAFDFGAGSYDYKLLFCKDEEPIFDSFIPLSVRGRFAVGAMSAVKKAKRFMRSNPALLDVARNLRSRFQRARTSEQLL
ncbi:Acetyltransferase involved in cellulose biosynthesis, CelD/BcsL family [Bradyrhizobium arachidis]|nr:MULTISPECIES: GNAT family N-acetyltransferase [Bradyrhizobium]UFW49198.1 GNAT family N-acetyltransferase [Bradyrhizobium arachidis]SFU39148.1 Acetyltransferase involved in cellulose biosynthesis, CelD/BcsL family [Bradyrhizobium arachidis]